MSPLLRLRVEALGPFVFVNLDRGAAPVAAWGRGADARIARTRLRQIVDLSTRNDERFIVDRWRGTGAWT